MKQRCALIALFLLAANLTIAAPANEMKAGLARVTITPEKPVWMAGYAARTKPFEGKLHELYAKALAVEDARGNRIVIVTTDLLGIPGALTSEIAEHANKSYGLKRGQILFNSSHTHSGPVLSGSLVGAYDLNAEQAESVRQYTAGLKQKMHRLIGEALRDLAPARLSLGRASAPFAMNRREWRDGQIANGVNREGVVDREVPVLRVESTTGTVRGILFGYACHNTTLTGQFHLLSGDYAGFAQLAIERAHPGAMALFVMGCGADVNPYPRSSIELGEKHGDELAAGVEEALRGPMRPVAGAVRSILGGTPIPFSTLPTREELRGRLGDANPFKRRHAERMLARYARDGKLMSEYPYTIQVLRIGELTIVGLAGEVVTDYALRLKRELGGDVWVAGYSNDLCSYIPSARMFKEGGYEVVESQIYYDMPAPYDPALEERIIGKVHQLARSIGRAPVSTKEAQPRKESR
ncbi:MAG: neutral/alkaline non-lysosomal ceramidase N-terminal domain-containing protein [Blastocatellia bacterium]|nr:neutral/alkaline non-lysosomal ceramidase N-terminal domain-containing protein [Blastocatellia bacterium]